MTTETTTYFTASGPVRGACGHHHKTPIAAQACADLDSRRMSAIGGGSYSDRRVVMHNGDDTVILFPDNDYTDWDGAYIPATSFSSGDGSLRWD